MIEGMFLTENPVCVPPPVVPSKSICSSDHLFYQIRDLWKNWSVELTICGITIHWITNRLTDPKSTDQNFGKKDDSTDQIFQRNVNSVKNVFLLIFKKTNHEFGEPIFQQIILKLLIFLPFIRIKRKQLNHFFKVWTMKK